MKTTIAIIGAGGKMGRWLCRYFLKKGVYSVQAFDKNTITSPLSKVIIFKSLNECVKNADIVILSVPVIVTPEIITQCVKDMKRNSTLIEISSIKKEVFDTLLKIPRTINPISVHPMFGPGAKKLKNKKIILIPVRNELKEKIVIKSIFNDSKLMIVNDPKAHDSLMSIILGLTYYISLVTAMVLSKETITILKKYAGTSFTLQSLLVESILTNDSSLITSLLMHNQDLKKHVSTYIRESDRIFKLILRKDYKKFEKKVDLIKEQYAKNSDIKLSYGKMYSLIDSMRTIN